jgi:MFS family permease
MFSAHLRKKSFFNALKVGLAFFPVAIFVSMFEFALPIGLESISTDLSLVGLFIGLSWIIVMFVDLFIGDFADIIGKKNGTLLGLFIFMTFTFLFFLTTDVWILFFLVILAYIGYDLFYISVQGFVVSEAPKKYLNFAAEGFYPLWDFGLIFGPLLGAFLITKFGQVSIYYSSIVFCGIAIIMGLFLSSTYKVNSNKSGDKKVSLREFFLYVKKLFQEDFWLLFGSMSCAFWYMLMIISIPLFFAVSEGDIWMSAITLTAFMIPIFLTDVIIEYVASTKKRRFFLVCLGYAFAGLSLIAFFLSSNYLMMAICAGLSTIGFQTIWATFDIEAGLLSKKGKEAMTQSVFFFSKNVGFGFAPFFFAIIVAFFGIKSPFISFGLISLVLALVFWFKHKKMNFK